MIKVFRCKHCGNISVKIVDSGVDLVCCGEVMEELVPNTVDASLEKHVPDVSKIGNDYEIQVGSVKHPMSEEHHIKFLILVSDNGFNVINLDIDFDPKVIYTTGDELKEVYAYCNLHGLWKKEID